MISILVNNGTSNTSYQVIESTLKRYNPSKLMRLILACLLLVNFSACSVGPTRSAKIHEGSEWIVQLSIVGDANQGRGYSHPVSISADIITEALTGLYVDYEPRSLPFLSNKGPIQIERTRVFTDDNSATLASLLADGLSQASPQEIVTFTQTRAISSEQEKVTSGGVFLSADELNVVLTNSYVTQQIKQDLETYQTPAHLNPLNPITSQPGRLVFHHARLMRSVTAAESDFVSMWSGINWHIAILYKQLQ